MGRVVTVATCQWQPEPVTSWEDYASLLASHVAALAKAGADIVLFPEYGSLQVLSFVAPRQLLVMQKIALQQWREAFVDLFEQCARELGVIVIAPGFPVQIDDYFVNRTWVCSPQSTQWQDKVHMTRFEQETLLVQGSPELQVFETDCCRFGIAVCYDSEFPLQVNALARAGAELILVPSCTDTLAGYHRVLLSSRARALENQCYVVQSVLCGDCDYTEAIDTNTGHAGIYTPVDRGFPDDGILALTEGRETEWLVQALDLDRLQSVRQNGQVRNALDWDVPFNVRVRLHKL